MSSEVKHSPTPWQIDPFSDEETIAICAGDVHIGILQSRDAEDEEASREADGEFIVRACNAHDDLFRELRHLVTLLEPLERDGGLNVPGLATLNGARAALAKAVPA